MVIGICDDNLSERRRLAQIIREFSAQMTIMTFSDGSGVVVLTERDVDQTYKKVFKIQVVSE